MISVVLGRITQFLLLLIMMRVATTYLSPVEVGRISVITTTTAFFALILVNPAGMFINRRLHAWFSLGRIKQYLRYYWLYLFLVSLAAAMVLAIIQNVPGISSKIDLVWLLGLVCGSLVFNTMNQTVIPSMNLLGFRNWFIGLTLATLAVGLGGGLFLIVYFKPIAEYWLLGLLIGQALFGWIGLNVFLKNTQPSQSDAVSEEKLTSKKIRVLFLFAWPIAIAVGLNWLQTQSYRFLIEHFLGLASLGLFFAGYGISAGLISALESVLTTYFLPGFYRQINTAEKEEQSLAWNIYAGAIFPAVILGIFCIAALASELTQLFLGPNFQTASQYVIWGALAEGSRVFAATYAMVAHARMTTRLLIYPNLIGSFISILLVWLLVPEIGPLGAGIGLAIAGLSVVFAMHFLMRPHLAIVLPRKSILISVAMGLLVLVISHLAHILLGENSGLPSSIGVLVLAGSVYMVFQYLLVYPFLNLRELI